MAAVAHVGNIGQTAWQRGLAGQARSANGADAQTAKARAEAEEYLGVIAPVTVIPHRNPVIHGKISSRHLANAVLKQAGIEMKVE